MNARLPRNRWERQEETFRLASKGVSPTEIAKQLGVARSTVYRDLHEVGAQIREFYSEMPEATRNAILRHSLDVAEELRNQLAGLNALSLVYSNILFSDDPPHINPIAHRALMEVFAQTLELLKIYAVLVGRHIPQPEQESPQAHQSRLRVIDGHGVG